MSTEYTLILTASSIDGFFFVEGDVEDWDGSWTEVEKFNRRNNTTVISMCLAGNLKPGVVVLTTQSLLHASPTLPTPQRQALWCHGR